MCGSICEHTSHGNTMTLDTKRDERVLNNDRAPDSHNIFFFSALDNCPNCVLAYADENLTVRSQPQRELHRRLGWSPRAGSQSIDTGNTGSTKGPRNTIVRCSTADQGLFLTQAPCSQGRSQLYVTEWVGEKVPSFLKHHVGPQAMSGLGRW